MPFFLFYVNTLLMWNSSMIEIHKIQALLFFPLMEITDKSYNCFLSLPIRTCIPLVPAPVGTSYFMGGLPNNSSHLWYIPYPNPSSKALKATSAVPGWLSWLRCPTLASGSNCDLRFMGLRCPVGSALSRESAWGSLFPSLPFPSISLSLKQNK